MTCVVKLSKKFCIVRYSVKFQEKSPNMSLIPVLVQQLLEFFVGGGGGGGLFSVKAPFTLCKFTTANCKMV